jgi:hypothetical protein
VDAGGSDLAAPGFAREHLSRAELRPRRCFVGTGGREGTVSVSSRRTGSGTGSSCRSPATGASNGMDIFPSRRCPTC